MNLEKNQFGFIEATPKLSPAELSAYYSEKYYQSNQAGGYSHTYTLEELEGISSNLKLMYALVEQFVRPDAPRTILDVGCGEGFTLPFFANQGWDVLGMDFSDDAIRRHNPVFVDRFIQGDFLKGLETFREQGNMFNVLWLDNVLEHVIEPLGLMKLCHDVTLPGGIIMVDVPNDFSVLQQEARTQGAIDRDFWVALPDHLSYFNATGLRHLAEAAGWEYCRTVSDFPIDFNLLHPAANYVMDRSVGRPAHLQRVRLTNLFARISVEKTLDLYQALADMELGRSINAVFRKPIR